KLRAPNAKKVSVNVEHVGNFDMTKGDDGVWTYATKSLAPDIYGYSYAVDGVTHFDPLNPTIKTNMVWASNMVTVPGSPPEVWEVQNVPHGSITRHFYKSEIIGDERDYLVYTPPGFNSSTKGLPVLYLLHGFSDTAVGWTDVGRAHVMMDNLIAQKKAKPMIVVMTLGYGIPDFVQRVMGGRRWNDDGVKSFSLFEEALLKEVKPAIERDYRTGTKPSQRAICGLSMGGAESLYVGLRNPGLFSAIGAFSSGGLPAEKPEDVIPAFDPAKAKNLELIWMICGTEDGLIGFQRGFSKWLKDKNAPVVTEETGGGHVWPLWRRNLASFAQKVFTK
ncbi:MAG TPA: alpha/beta hydrolase-fold protein, partial [Fimbriimonas sp.]|nr:alpha/beta hydrolase-fold protein [Fimbriimonas sp.]